ncbi:MAG: NfeD family protein [Planctomycetota bacterium]|jgi:membrane-bound serine protease (ClpP class)
MTIPILLVIGCLAVLILEVFVVSFGVLSVVAVALGVSGVVLAFRESQAYGWVMVGVLFVGAPAALWSAFKLLPRLPFARGLYLRRPKLTEAERHAAARPHTELLGAAGEATSPLRPSGTAVFDGVPVHVVTTGHMLAKGTRVRVTEVTGNRVVVEEIE